MVHRCCVSSCGMSVRVLEAKGLSYHKFPTKENVRDQWVQAIIPHMDNPDNFKVVPRYTRVCSRHFRKKDYCVDAKKRARLISNAVPSVFPRKNTPLVVPTVLPTSPKGATAKHQAPTLNVPGTSTCQGNDKTASNCPTRLGSPQVLNFNEKRVAVSSEFKSNQLNDILSSPELILEALTVKDDTVSFVIIDPPSQIDCESVSAATSDDQSLASTNVLVDDNNDGSKRRKRRKWNRTAFARPAKGKRKSLCVKPESSDEQDVCESLSKIPSLDSGDGKSDSVLEMKLKSKQDASKYGEKSGTTNEIEGVSTVTLTLSDFQNQEYHINHGFVEQELLQSIQAVSLTCGGEEVTTNELQENETSAEEPYLFSNLIPAFLHHHSSEESLFSNESQNVGIAPGEVNPVSQSDIVTEDDSLRDEMFDLRLDEFPSSQATTCLDIEELAQQLNCSSLFADGNMSSLFSNDNLSLDADPSTNLSMNQSLVSTSTTNVTDHEEAVKISDKNNKQNVGSKKVSPGKSKACKATEAKSASEKKLKGVTKRPKVDKIAGRFSVERFKSSDKDIEYYTGFCSYRSFEAFFRSLEAYIEKICITDVNYCVNNLPPDMPGSSSSSTDNTPNKQSDQPKKRPSQGRSMSRIDELFVTIIRLRRKLPEKVLGHMFFISQPTVSRVVRAWTVLLSKIIDSYPVTKSTGSGAAHKEHSYTTKGLAIPDSFRDLFYSDLAKSIVVTSLNPKKMKPKTAVSDCSRHKKSKKSPETPMKEDCVKIEPKKAVNDSDYLANIENPEPIEKLQLFGTI